MIPEGAVTKEYVNGNGIKIPGAILGVVVAALFSLLQLQVSSITTQSEKMEERLIKRSEELDAKLQVEIAGQSRLAQAASNQNTLLLDKLEHQSEQVREMIGQGFKDRDQDRMDIGKAVIQLQEQVAELQRKVEKLTK